MNEPNTTYDRLMQDKDFNEKYQRAYREFILSELLLAIMQEDHISIRKLALEAGVSPSLIQDIRSGKKDNLTFKSFSNIIDALGYDIILEKREHRTTKHQKFRMKTFGKRTRSLQKT